MPIVFRDRNEGCMSRRQVFSGEFAKVRHRVLALAFLIFLASAVGPAVHAQGASLSERQKIEALIKYVGEMSDAKFVRNGSTYEAKTAALFLRLKWKVNDSEVKTARDFH